MPRQIIPSKMASEVWTWQPDFTGLFASSGDTISSQATSAMVYSGVDASPSAILSGAPSHSGLVGSQKLTGGVVGVVYYLTFLATSSAGEVIEISAFLAVVPDVV